MRVVERGAELGDKPIGLTMFRIFRPALTREKGISIEDYSSLDNYPELILYEGYYQPSSVQPGNITSEKMPER